MPGKVTIGVHLQTQNASLDEYGSAWARADAMGIDAIWNWDHFFNPLPNEPVEELPNFEAWTTLAAFGAQTKHAQVGCLVLSMSYRNPALLSFMASTLDHITHGRLILGVGAGWFERDYTEFGYPFGTAGERLRGLERGLITIKERWAKDPLKPVRGTVPILIGGGGEKVTLRLVAEHAQQWNGGGNPAEFAAKSAILNEWCAKVGRDPATILRTTSIHQHQIPLIDDYLAAGAQQIIVRVPAPWDFGPIEPLLVWRDKVNGS